MSASEAVTALLPAFVAGFAVQRLLEACDFNAPDQINKRIMTIASIVIALGLVLLSGLDDYCLEILAALKGTKTPPFDWLDVIVSTLVISAGTDGVNSILKFLNYKKEETQAKANAPAQAAHLTG